MSNRFHSIAILVVATCLGCSAAMAQEAAPPAAGSVTGAARQPLWELGIAAGFGTTADYPGSGRYHLRAIPFPYFIYRGNFFRSDQNGTRVRAAYTRNLEIDISGGASFATHSSGSGPRTGMPDLDYLLELGPKLKYIFARPAPGVAWFTEIPLRAVISIGSGFGYRGLVFAPNIGVRTVYLLGSPWAAYADIGPEFASGRFQDYFYQVAARYARPGRPAYNAHGGYFGSRLEAGLSRPIGKHFRIFFYSRLEDYNGAKNTNSPLFQTRLGYAGFIGFSWSFLHSDATVPINE